MDVLKLSLKSIWGLFLIFVVVVPLNAYFGLTFVDFFSAICIVIYLLALLALSKVVFAFIDSTKFAEIKAKFVQKQ